MNNKILIVIYAYICAATLCGCTENIIGKVEDDESYLIESSRNNYESIYETEISETLGKDSDNRDGNYSLEALIETYMKALANDTEAIIKLIGKERLQNILNQYGWTKEEFEFEYLYIYQKAVSDGLVEDDEELKNLFINYKIISVEQTDESVSGKNFDATYEVDVKVGEDNEFLYIGENNGMFYFDEDVEDDVYSDLVFMIENYFEED